MDAKFVNIYQHYGIAPPEQAVGDLTCWITHTPGQVSACRKRPAILVLPGGGYHHTSKRENQSVAIRLAAFGWQVFVLEYSVAPNTFPTALREAAYAMRYIREHGEEFELDTHMVAAMGFSAGGHLCGTLGTLYDSPEVADIGPAELIRPDALGLCYPVTVSWGRTHEGSFHNLCGSDGELARRLSLDALVRPDMPPVYLWHTRNDASVPCRNSLVLASALEEAGVDFAMRIYRQGQHGLSTGDIHSFSTAAQPPVSPKLPLWIEEMTDFFGECGLIIQDFEVMP